MTDYQDLISRLEKAKGPDRELGDKVLFACGWTRNCVGHFHGPMYRWRGPDGKSYEDGEHPDPTASLDAAVGLVPEGAYFKIQVGRDHKDTWCWVEMKDVEAVAFSKVPALALCIAALKGRQASEEG